MRVQDICKRSIDWLIDEAVFPKYEESGRFVATLSQGPGALEHPQQLVAHYAICRGPLYDDLTNWRRVMTSIRSFTSAALASRDRVTWKLAAPFGEFAGIPPWQVLSELCSAFGRAGLAVRDRDEAAGSAVFRCESVCATFDLPEPYGKWFQHQERWARWEEQLELAIEVSCTVHCRVDSSGLNTTLADFELSTLAPSVILDVQSHLARAAQFRHLRNRQSVRDLGRQLADGARILLSRL